MRGSSSACITGVRDEDIVASSVLVPLTIFNVADGWQFAWFALALACAGSRQWPSAPREKSRACTRNVVGHAITSRRRCTPLAAIQSRAGRLRFVRRRLYRLHDVHRGVAA